MLTGKGSTVKASGSTKLQIYPQYLYSHYRILGHAFGPKQSSPRTKHTFGELMQRQFASHNHALCNPFPLKQGRTNYQIVVKSRSTENTRVIRRAESKHNNGILALWWVMMATIDPPLVGSKHVLLLSLHPAVCYHHLSYTGMPVTSYTVMPTWW